MFQLESSLSNWKRKLTDSNSFTKSDIDELESHLLDEIETLKKDTLTEEEAFYVACSRIGSVDLLSGEFSKANYNVILLKKILWLLSGYILISFLQQLINSLSAYVITAFSLTELSAAVITNLVLSIIILSLLFIPKFMLIPRLQAKFNFLFSYKKWLLVLIFLVFTVFNTVGFKFFDVLLIRQIEWSQFMSIQFAHSISSLIWSPALCILFILLSFKHSAMSE